MRYTYNKSMDKNKFKTLLKAAGINQLQFADMAGLNKDTVSNWNSGRVPFPGWVQGYLEGLILKQKLKDIKDII